MNRQPFDKEPSDIKQTGRYAARPEISWSEAWALVDRLEEYLQRLMPTADREGPLNHGIAALTGIRRALVLLKSTLRSPPGPSTPDSSSKHHDPPTASGGV